MLIATNIVYILVLELNTPKLVIAKTHLSSFLATCVSELQLHLFYETIIIVTPQVL